MTRPRSSTGAPPWKSTRRLTPSGATRRDSGMSSSRYSGLEDGKIRTSSGTGRGLLAAAATAVSRTAWAKRITRERLVGRAAPRKRTADAAPAIPNSVTMTAPIPKARSPAMAYEVPALPYPHDALEPHIDARTMEIHHGKHHAAYVTNLNKALEGSSGLQALSIQELCASLGKVPDA